MNKTAKILAAVGAAAASAAALTVSTVSDYAINARSKMFPDRHAGETPLPQSERTKQVTIQNSDGLKLTGHFLRANNPKRVVIAVHGWRSSWQHDFHSQCEILELLNCDILFIDQRAHGRSEGKYIGFGITERFDCLEWLDFIETHNQKNLPVYLFGISMGATTVMLASELIGSGRVRGIIADCGFTSAGDIWRYAIQQKARRGSRSFYCLSDLRCIRKAGYRGDTRSTVQALKNTDIPLLFFHGSEDKFVPTYMSRISYESCASKKRLVIVDGAKHNGSCRTDPIRYRRELENFFNYNETVATDDTLQ